MRAKDAAGAVGLAEGAVCQRVFVAVEGVETGDGKNAFGESVAVQRGGDAAALVREAARAAGQGERVAVLARASDLAAARRELAAIAAWRLGVVVHAFVDGPRGDGAPATGPGAEGDNGMGAALALADLPWGMLVAAGVGEALDLALVAHRAAEDSGCPFFVVHERVQASRPEEVVAPTGSVCEAFLGGARPVKSQGGDARAVAARVPFALGSAMRELDTLTVRRHDVLLRKPNADAHVALVGIGEIAETMLVEVERLRATGHDVTAVRLVSWRPFPGPRLVKALCRSLAVTVLEPVDRPLAVSSPLAAELKAAFADALTWAPDYPGIGRIPRIASGAIVPGRALDPSDVDAIVHNMLADERGKRSFVVGGHEAHTLPPPAAPARTGT
jgi:pyruvate ferredoxin oxidoreductase alpha subunit